MLKKGLLKRASALICSAAMLLPLSGIGRNSSAYAEAASVTVSDEIGLAANLFCIADENIADHAALQWATTLSADSFTLYRSTSPDKDFVPVYTGNGTSYSDNNMQTGHTYYYQLKVTSRGEGKLFLSQRAHAGFPPLRAQHLRQPERQQPRL